MLLGDLGQQLELNEIREQVDRMYKDRDLVNWDIRKLRELADELTELELRHGLLVRLLIRKGLITAEEYAELIAATQGKTATE